MAMAITPLAPASHLARAVLRFDAATCAASGVVMIAGARPVSRFLGIGSATALVVLGALFLLYAALLFVAADREQVERRAVLLPAIANSAWVVLSVVAIAEGTPTFSTGGKWAVALVAD